MPVRPEREYRTMEAMAAGEGEYIVEGYATTFADPYLLYEYDGIRYLERIDPHALDGADMSDVIMQFDHAGRVVARTSNGTLALRADGHGLHTRADLSKTAAARSLYEDIGAELITGMSWSFTVAEDELIRDGNDRIRNIRRIKKVYDVSAVSLPANPGTEISARSWVNGVIDAERSERTERRRKLLIIKAMKEANT